MTFRLRPEVTNPEFEFVDSGCYMGYNCDLSQATCEGKCYKDQTAYVTPGDKVVAVASVKNIGNAPGMAILKVYHGSTKLCETNSGFDIDPGQTRLIWHSCFDMPSVNRDIEMKVYFGSRQDDSIGHRALKHKLKRAWRRMLKTI